MECRTTPATHRVPIFGSIAHRIYANGRVNRKGEKTCLEGRKSAISGLYFTASPDILTLDSEQDRRDRADRSGLVFFRKGFDTMAVKKSTGTTKKEGSAAKGVAVAKKSDAKKGKAPQKTTAKPAAAKKAATAKKAPAKKAAPVKLTDRQQELLRNIHAKKEEGYPADSKSAAKSLEQLKDKKLVKKGAKNKTTGHVHYHISKAGEKHVGTAAAPPAPAPAATAPAPATAAPAAPAPAPTPQPASNP